MFSGTRISQSQSSPNKVKPYKCIYGGKTTIFFCLYIALQDLKVKDIIVLICLHSLSSVLETLDSKLAELERIRIAVDSSKLLGKLRELKKTRPDAE